MEPLRKKSPYSELCSFLRIWSHLLKKSLMENFIFRAVNLASIIPIPFRNIFVEGLAIDESMRSVFPNLRSTFV